jgi:hypothetical protein
MIGRWLPPAGLAVLLTLSPPAPGGGPVEDYTRADPARLGVAPVPPRKDAKTGFVVAGKNPTSLLLKLTEIAGRPVAELEEDMRPGRLSTAGFLGKDERLLDVLAADNRYVVEELGLTHQELARHLRLLGAVAVREALKESKVVAYHGRRYRLQATRHPAFVKSPFEDGTRTNCEATVENLDNGRKLTYSLLVPEMIERYGFYEGKGTRYRVEPRAVVAALDFLRPAERPGDEAGWRKLFDGKTLEGWKACDFYGAGKVHVKDGALVMEKGKLMTGVTFSKGGFPKMDYEVTLEGKKVAGDDFFCTTTFPVGDSFCSLVVGGWSGTVVGLSSVDFMDASMNETRKDKEFEAGRWYRVRIRVSQKRIEAWIDREQVVDLDTTDRRLSIRTECNACRPFGIATYETTGAVRDVRVRSLTDAEKKALAEKKSEKKE